MPGKSKGKIPTSVGIVIFILTAAFFFGPAVYNGLQPSPKQKANTSLAKGNLRTLSTACESYASTHKNLYPTNIEELLATAGEPPYINQDYCRNGSAGYSYQCSFLESGYRFSATSVGPPASPANKTFTITTGGVVSWKD